MTRTLGRATFVAALLCSTAGAAMAANGNPPAYDCGAANTPAPTTTCINGGGSSLAANVYANFVALSSPLNGELTQYAQSTGGSDGFSYEKASSGAGQQALFYNDPSKFSNGDPVNEFTVHYAASDAFIDTNSVFDTNGGTGPSYIGQVSLPNNAGPFIQIPMFATPITIPVGNPKMVANGTVNLNDTDLCGIFSGLITNWNKTSANKAFGASTIKVYWRADNAGSGTSFLLTQHLAKVCTAANTEAGFTFKATTKFATLFNGVNGAVAVAPPPGNTTQLWAITPGHNNYAGNFVGVKGSNGVADGVNNDTSNAGKPSATGYVSPDYTSIAATPATATAGLRPYTDLFVAGVYNASNNQAYLPNLTALNLALTNPGSSSLHGTAPTTLAAAQIQTNWVAQIPLPAAGYPILGYTNWLLLQCYKNTAVAPAITGFLTQHLAGTYTTLLHNNGFQPVSGALFGTAVQNTFVTNKSTFNLNIGNKTICAKYTGR